MRPPRPGHCRMLAMRLRIPAVAAAAIAVSVLVPVIGALPTPAATTQWPMYHLDAGRSGNDTGEPSFASMRGAWTSAALDGLVYAEPLVYGSLVMVATENNSVFAFNAGSGAPVWHTRLGAPRTSNFPCGNINPLGITGTPVIDGGALFVVAEVGHSSTSYTFNLARINPASGAVVYNRDITPTGMNVNYQQERSALAVSAGNVVVAWGGLNGD